MKPRKQKTAASRSRARQFLWVNKDVTSTYLSRSGPSELLKIQRFIQQNASCKLRTKRRSSCEETHTFSVTPRGPSSEAVDMKSIETNLEPFNCRLSRWRLISPRQSTTYRHKSCADLNHNRQSESSSLNGLTGKSGYSCHSVLEKLTPNFGSRIVDFHRFIKEFIRGGLLRIQTTEFALDLLFSALSGWAARYSDIFLGLIILYHCLHTGDRCHKSFLVNELRSHFLQALDRRLDAAILDEALVQTILLALHIDLRLEHMEFAIAHATAMENIISFWNIECNAAQALPTDLRSILTDAAAHARSQLNVLLNGRMNEHIALCIQLPSIDKNFELGGMR